MTTRLLWLLAAVVAGLVAYGGTLWVTGLRPRDLKEPHDTPGG